MPNQRHGRVCERLDDRRVEEYEERWEWRRDLRWIKKQMTRVFVCVGAFPLPSPSLNPTANSSSTTALTSRVWVNVCVKEQRCPLHCSHLEGPFTFYLHFLHHSSDSQQMRILAASWALLGPLEFVYTFFTLCVLLVFYVLTGCESNQRSSSFDKTHPGNSDPQTHFRRKEIDSVFAHLN